LRKLVRVTTPLLIVFFLAACSSTASNITRQPTGVSSPAARATSATVPPHPTQPASIFTHSITYVALGASDAIGIGSNVPGSQGYVPLIAARLPKGSHLLNLGISGIHLHEALGEELPLALSTSPDLITIWLVANDFIAGVPFNGYMQDLNTLLSQLHQHTHALIVMANLPDLTRLLAFANLNNAQKTRMLTGIELWNRSIAQEAARYGVRLVDLFSHGSELTAHPEYISGDGFHPSPAGYVRLAELFWQAIQ
jgi:acyl-CoA thioesterase-1